MKNLKENLIFEIGTEELPSSCLNEGLKLLKTNLSDNLAANRISFESIETFGTPRRLIAFVKGAGLLQAPLEKQLTGPPVKIAFNEDGTYGKAAEGFARGLGIKTEELEIIETDKGSYIGKNIYEEGRKSIEVIPEILSDTIKSINFSKQMTWGDYSIKFARPIRWMSAFLGNEMLEFEIESLKSSSFTYGHRTLSAGAIKIISADSFIENLEKEGKIIVRFEERKSIILNKIKEIEAGSDFKNLKILLNEDLLEEIVNLVEVPNVLVGSFPEIFLKLPRDILIKAIEYHQRYMAVLKEDNELSNLFIVVQNGIEDKNNEIIKGNERVLRARLYDAAFFYDEDKKHSWENWIEKLKGVVFYSKFGSIYDKSLRVEKLCLSIIDEISKRDFPLDSNISKDCSRASILCKADLVSNLVVEFPELQGVVGREYARERNENSEVSSAIFEHYLPRFLGDGLPETNTGAILSVADKIDSITGLFLAGNIPSGSEDPFALRRRAAGIILTILKKNISIDLRKIIDISIGLYSQFISKDNFDKNKALNEITDFIFARLKFFYEKKSKRTDIIDAVIGADNFDIIDISLRYDAIEEIIKSGKIEEITIPMIRCKNIIKDKAFKVVNSALLKESEEKSLFVRINDLKDKFKKLISDRKYESVLSELIIFRKDIDVFFDKVLIMDKDEQVKDNRINLVKSAYDIYMQAADFSKISAQASLK